MTIYGDKIFKNPVKILCAFTSSEVKTAFDEIERLRKKYFLVGYCRYEMKNIFSEENFSYPYPLLYFEVFEEFEEFSPAPAQEIKINPVPTIDFEEYDSAINKIKEEIANGNTYEVNYTMDFDVEYHGSELALYNSLLERQKTPFNAFFKNEFETILSFSPELFFEIENGKILTRPMKGTIARGKTKEEDLTNIEFLKNDIKNRAENVMIVDLLRNDLGRIAKTGSVKVKKLFSIETHKTLHQMTSEITAELKEDTSLYEVFKSIFPCGSITGAPKISTMKIIDKIEKGKRNVYCGAIGFLSPEKCVFSVPIRILQCQNDETFFKYRAGGAIVWDSIAKDEWDEVFTKMKFLQPDFNLIETMLVKNGKILFEKEHFERLSKSAEFFGFPAPEILFNHSQDGILRVIYSKNGDAKFELKELKQNLNNKIIFSDANINSKNIFLYHKTDFKPWFWKAYEKIQNNEVFDVIFSNEKGEITEGARSNIVIQKDGKLFTPPLKCGRLDGIYLRSMSGVSEKVLFKHDLINADRIFCVNSVRGCVEVKL